MTVGDPAELPHQRTTDQVDAWLRALERFTDIAELTAGSLDLDGTLRQIVRAVVTTLGFDAAVVHLVGPEGMTVAAMEGPASMRERLAGKVEPLATWQALLDRAAAWGDLRFIDGRTAASDIDAGLTPWVPDLPVSDDPSAWHPLDSLMAPLRDPEGNLIGVLSVDLPVDRRRPTVRRLALLQRLAHQAELAIDRARIHARLAESEELFRRTFESAPVGMALAAGDGTLLQVNSIFATYVDRDEAGLIGASVFDVVHPLDLEAVRAAFHALTSGEARTVSGNVRGGGERWGRAHACRVDSGGKVSVLLHVEDITEARRSREALQRRATTDPLTGVLNRAALLESIRRIASGRRQSTLALLFCDLDLFKLVNDTHGHSVGDQVLRTVADRMRATLRDSDLIGRFGGDEFVVCLPHVDGPVAAIDVADRLLLRLDEPIPVPGGEVRPAASIGITLGTLSNDTDLDRLLAEADSALYRAKHGGRARWELFAESMADPRGQLNLRDEILLCLDRDELRVHYQPVLDLDENRVVGYEALLRWEHPRRGLLLPADFIDLLMDGPVAGNVTDWLIDRAIADVAVWRASDPDLRISVNIDPRQLARRDFAAQVIDSLDRQGLDPSALVLELVEQTLPAGDEPGRQLRALREAGVRVAIDDLGKGYSGLLTLRDIPANVVKLDREFARHIGEPVTEAIVSAVVDLAARLGQYVVAEGIETETQLAAFRRLGIRYGQGYLFGPPAPRAGAVKPVARRPRVLPADLSERVRRLEAALAMATDARQVAEVGLLAASRILGTVRGAVLLLDPAGERLELVHIEGYPTSAVERLQSVPVADSAYPMATVARTGEPLFVSSEQAAEWVRRQGWDWPFRPAAAILPLVGPPRPGGGPGAMLGVLSVAWPACFEFGEPVRDYLTDLAARVAARLAALPSPAAAAR